VSKPVDLYDAKTHLSELVDRAAEGEEIIIAKAGTPKARLVPLNKPAKPRQPGAWRGRVRVARDFDAPLPDTVLEGFEGEKDPAE
jgi:prevent-host-death family protein